MMNSSSPRQNNFNFLRLFFAFAVIVSHSTELGGGDKNHEILYRLFHTVTIGELAVDGFFLLSGYLIVQSWINTPEIWQFLKKRILRIYPGFIIASLICVFVVGPLGNTNPQQYFAHLSLPGVLTNMLRLLQPEGPPVFQGQPYPILNGAMWTISYEFKCYLAVLVLGAVGLLRKRALVLAIAALMLLIVASQKFGFSLPIPKAVADWASLRGPTFRFAAFFFTGACFYLYRSHIRLNGRAATVVAAVLLATMLMGWAAVLEVMLPVLGAYVLFYLGFKPMAPLANFGKLPDISYGVYLYGWPVQKLLLWYFPGIAIGLLMLVSAFGALVLGLMSWYVIEKPCLSLKAVSWRRKRGAATDAAQADRESVAYFK